MTRRPNVYILSVDSLPYTAFAEVSERLASLVNGVNFTQAIAPASFTSSAMPALATGSLTDEVPAWGLPESGGPTPIAEELAVAGYDCGLWTDNYLFGSAYNYDRGFSAGNLGSPNLRKRIANVVRETPLDRLFWLFETTYFKIVEPLLSASTSDASFYRHASELNGQATDWVDGRRSESPVFCWLHYMDTHHPYQPPQSYLEERQFNETRTRSELGEFTREAIKSNGSGLSPAEESDLQRVYDASCAYVGDELAERVERLRRSEHYDPDVDVLVVTADHGEVLDRSKYGMLGHVPPAFWEEIVHVPLVVSHPDWSRGTIDEQVSVLDLKRIVLDAAGVSESSLDPADLSRSTAPFVSEWEELDDGSITTFRGVRHEDGLKMFGTKRDGENRLVATRVDGRTDTVVEAISPGDSWSTFPDWSTDLRREVSGDLIEFDSDVSDAETDVDESHLRNLGYIE